MTPSAALADRELQVEDLYASARGDFGTFVELAFLILHPDKKFVHAAYLDVLFALMEDCAAGREPRVIVNLPPGFMKSMLISIMYVAWRLGIDPTLKFVCISYGDDLAHKHSASTRTLMQSPEYRAICPERCSTKRPRTGSPQRRAAIVTRLPSHRNHCRRSDRTGEGELGTGKRKDPFVDIKFGRAHSLRGQCEERDTIL